MLILASASPRRCDLLQEWGYHFLQCKVTVSEEFPLGVSAEEGVRQIARRKAQACAQLYQKDCGQGTDSVILASDTIIVFQGLVLGKPRDRAHGHRMLHMLSGNTHTVLTAVAVVELGVGSVEKRWRTQTQSTLVEFARLTDEDVENYLDTGEWEDKAGGYAIQGRGRSLISRYEGSESNVIGLPKETVRLLLDSFNITAKAI